ncbi:MAG: cytidylate kinase-like family protein [Blautia sp.]|nr:cytidylate kinase-like family protein [Lachnoclostridium sp.]MCM1212423.1 cytidylate kinase-like family protein [Blautia sp.]
MKNYVITISRGFGSGGSHIARKVSEELGIAYYDIEILQMAADLSGINERYFFEANEKIRKNAIAINASKGAYEGRVYQVNDKRYLSDENYFNFQAQVIKDLAAEDKEPCVIIGKAANHVLRDFKNVVKIDIHAPMDLCVSNIMERLQKSKGEAEELIIKTNKYRANYYKYFTGHHWLDPAEYDISINTKALGEDYAAKLIIQLVRDRGLLEA